MWDRSHSSSQIECWAPTGSERHRCRAVGAGDFGPLCPRSKASVQSRLRWVEVCRAFSAEHVRPTRNPGNLDGGRLRWAEEEALAPRVRVPPIWGVARVSAVLLRSPSL